MTATDGAPQWGSVRIVYECASYCTIPICRLFAVAAGGRCASVCLCGLERVLALPRPTCPEFDGGLDRIAGPNHGNDQESPCPRPGRFGQLAVLASSRRSAPCSVRWITSPSWLVSLAPPQTLSSRMGLADLGGSASSCLGDKVHCWPWELVSLLCKLL